MITHSPEETGALAEDLVSTIKNGRIIGLYGDLGSGKTVFSRSLAEALGVRKFSVKSPTYTYIRVYKHQNIQIYHMDLYRLDTIDELLLQEISELMSNKKNIIIIEWAEKMENYLPKNCIKIYFRYLDENSREIIIKGKNERQ